MVNTDFTFPELERIHHTRKLVSLFGAGVINAQELAFELVQDLVLSNVDRVIEHCASLIPIAGRPALVAHIDELARKNYFGKTFLIGPGYTPEEERALRPRFALVSERLRRFFAGPDTSRELPPADLDVYWALLRNCTSVAGEPCRITDCSRDRMTSSVYCAWHHYLKIKGREPPGEFDSASKGG